MRYVVRPHRRRAHIRREIYGQFSEHLGRGIYGGIYVGEDSQIPNTNGMRNDVVQALRAIRVPLLRWPGGCFADEYHWRDGIGPKFTRKRMVNTHWGGVVEDNAFGTHEFFELCRQLACEPYVNGNVGSGTVQEMQEWVEYMTGPEGMPMAALRCENGQPDPWHLRYFGVGNENWGCGGNMTAEAYADLYRRYQTYVRNYGDTKLYRIACGTSAIPSNTGYDWTRTLMRNAGHLMDGLSLHYYTLPTEQARSATAFTAEDYLTILARAHFIDPLIRNHAAIMDEYDPERRVGMIVDEWGTWFDVEPGTNPGFLYQQNTMRDAMVAALTLNIFNKHAARVHMANLAQMVNVLQALILTDGADMVLTPTYHVFDLYAGHQDATLVDSLVECPTFTREGIEVPILSESASIDEAGTVHITLANLSPSEAMPVELRLDAMQAVRIKGRIVTGAIDAYNDFGRTAVRPAPFSSISLAWDENGTEARLSLPPCSIVSLVAEA